jgi:hypothetical protein
VAKRIGQGNVRWGEFPIAAAGEGFLGCSCPVSRYRTSGGPGNRTNFAEGDGDTRDGPLVVSWVGGVRAYIERGKTLVSAAVVPWPSLWVT